jgi:hypothetical protein
MSLTFLSVKFYCQMIFLPLSMCNMISWQNMISCCISPHCIKLLYVVTEQKKKTEVEFQKSHISCAKYYYQMSFQNSSIQALPKTV